MLPSMGARYSQEAIGGGNSNTGSVFAPRAPIRMGNEGAGAVPVPPQLPSAPKLSTGAATPLAAPLAPVSAPAATPTNTLMYPRVGGMVRA